MPDRGGQSQAAQCFGLGRPPRAITAPVAANAVAVFTAGELGVDSTHTEIRPREVRQAYGSHTQNRRRNTDIIRQHVAQHHGRPLPDFRVSSCFPVL